MHLTELLITAPTLLLRILPNQLDQLRPDTQRPLIQLRNLLLLTLSSPSSAALTPHTQQCKQLFHTFDFTKHLILHLRISLQFVLCRVLQLLYVVQRKDAGVAS